MCWQKGIFASKRLTSSQLQVHSNSWIQLAATKQTSRNSCRPKKDEENTSRVDTNLWWMFDDQCGKMAHIFHIALWWCRELDPIINIFPFASIINIFPLIIISLLISCFGIFNSWRASMGFFTFIPLWQWQWLTCFAFQLFFLLIWCNIWFEDFFNSSSCESSFVNFFLTIKRSLFQLYQKLLIFLIAMKSSWKNTGTLSNTVH